MLEKLTLLVNTKLLNKVMILPMTRFRYSLRYLDQETAKCIGAGSRRAGGQLTLWKYFALPPWATCASPSLRTVFRAKQTQSEFDKDLFLREHLHLEQERGPSPAQTIFLENAYFWDKKATQIRRRPFF